MSQSRQSRRRRLDWYRAAVVPSFRGARITTLEVYDLGRDGGAWVVTPPPSKAGWRFTQAIATSFEPEFWGTNVQISFFATLGVMGPRHVERIKQMTVDGVPYVRRETVMRTPCEREFNLREPDPSRTAPIRRGAAR